MSSMKDVTCIEDLRALAQRRVPRAFFDYADAGSYAEETLRANRADLEKVKLRQRVLIDVTSAISRPRLSGRKRRFRSRSRRSACAACSMATAKFLPRAPRTRPAFRSASPPCRSARSRTWRRRPDKPFWFQLYVIRDRDFIKDLIARAKAANCSALVLTVDLQILGQRHRDIKNGMTVPPEIRIEKHHRHRDQAALGLERAERAQRRHSEISQAT